MVIILDVLMMFLWWTCKCSPNQNIDDVLVFKVLKCVVNDTKWWKHWVLEIQNGLFWYYFFTFSLLSPWDHLRCWYLPWLICRARRFSDTTIFLHILNKFYKLKIDCFHRNTYFGVCVEKVDEGTLRLLFPSERLVAIREVTSLSHYFFKRFIDH